MAKAWAANAGIALDQRADVAIGVQLDWSIRAAIANGRLQPGERFPALRDLADVLGVNHNTVRAAVAKLTADGLLETRHGTGTFVAEGVAAHERHAPLVEQTVRSAAEAGVSPRELAAALYVAGDEPRPEDPAAQERRALRDEIALLERLIARLETALPHRPPPDAEGQTRGARLLSNDELQARRDGLVRRLAAVQRLVDGEDEGTEPEPAPEKAPAKPRGASPRVAPAPRTAPA